MRLCADYICDWLLILFYITHTHTHLLYAHIRMAGFANFFTYTHTTHTNKQIFYNFVYSL